MSAINKLFWDFFSALDVSSWHYALLFIYLGSGGVFGRFISTVQYDLFVSQTSFMLVPMIGFGFYMQPNEHFHYKEHCFLIGFFLISFRSSIE